MLFGIGLVFFSAGPRCIFSLFPTLKETCPCTTPLSIWGANIRNGVDESAALGRIGGKREMTSCQAAIRWARVAPLTHSARRSTTASAVRPALWPMVGTLPRGSATPAQPTAWGAAARSTRACGCRTASMGCAPRGRSSAHAKMSGAYGISTLALQWSRASTTATSTKPETCGGARWMLPTSIPVARCSVSWAGIASSFGSLVVPKPATNATATAAASARPLTCCPWRAVCHPRRGSQNTRLHRLPKKGGIPAMQCFQTSRDF